MSAGRYSLDYVRRTYCVPVKRGMRVVTECGKPGVVTCGDGAHVRVRVDGEKRSGRWHPLALDYLDGVTPAARLAQRNARIDIWNDRLNGRITQQEYADRWAAS